MKQRYSVMLEPESAERVKSYLASSGLSFSGFLSTLVIGFAKSIDGQPVLLNKPVGELTFNEFQQLSSYWLKLAGGVVDVVNFVERSKGAGSTRQEQLTIK